jgi:ankyrin repeat protein
MRRIAWIFLVAACVLVAACDKNTPLMDKVVAGDKAGVSALIAKGADVNARNNYGWTALSHAARAGNAELVKLLLAHGADVNARDQSGWTALMRAAMKGHVDVVRVLLEHGAAVNDQEKEEGWTALHWAAARGHDQVVALLLSHGADYKLRTNDGMTPLMLAMKENNDKVIQALQQAGERE